MEVIVRFWFMWFLCAVLSVAQPTLTAHAAGTGSIPGDSVLQTATASSTNAASGTGSAGDSGPGLVTSSPTARWLDVGGTSGSGWALERIRAAKAWNLADGSGIVVAVLDSGVSTSHPELSDKVLRGWNFVHGNGDIRDEVGHGTFTAGVIAAHRDSGGGVSGIAPGAHILPVKVLDHQGEGSTSNFVAGIRYAVDRGARVINISASGLLDTQGLIDALKYAESHDVVVVASAGNQSGQKPSYPAVYPTVLAVTASGSDDTVAEFSSLGAYVDLAAPGKDIRSTWWAPDVGDGYINGSGTSAAAAFVSGTAALVMSTRPDLSPAQVRQLLAEAAVDIDASGIDAGSGFGRLDAYAATRLAAPVTPTRSAELRLVPSADGHHLQMSSGSFQPNEPVTLWVTDSSGGHWVRQGLVALASGGLSADLGLASQYPAGLLTVCAVGEASGTVAVAHYEVTLVPSNPAFAPLAPFSSTPDRRYFSETGHSLAFGFKTYWEAHGGLAVFGYPISEEFTEWNPKTGVAYTVQYFERNRFEYHPEFRGTPFEVSLGRLGSEVASQVFPVAPAMEGRPGTRYFPETQHALSGEFLRYWESHGGLAIFGYPISEPFEERGRLVQYFERNRFEYHPSLPGAHRVLLARFGVDLARQAGYLESL